jgi:hypothetical protein
MPAPCRFEGVVEYLGWRITMKRKQAGTLVFYRNSDRVQTSLLCTSRAIASSHSVDSNLDFNIRIPLQAW